MGSDEARSSASLSEVPIELLLLDAEHRIRYANRRAAAITPGDAVGTPLRDRIDDDDHAGLAAFLAATVAADGREREFTCRTRDGGHARLVARATAGGVLVAWIDVGEDVETIRRLRTRERQLRLFVEHTPAAVAMVDRDMRYLAVSRRWITDYRLPEADLIGRSHYDVFPELPERWREVHRRCLAGAIESCEDDPFERADGSVDFVRWSVHPWRDEHDEVGGIVMFTEVVTARRQLEERLRQAEKMEAVGRLIGGIAHDFNNVLCAIRGFAELAQLDLDADHEVRRHVDGILLAAISAAELVGGLLAFGRKQPLGPKPRDVDEAVREVEPLLRRVLREDIRFEPRLAAGDAVVDVDATLVSTTLMNLVANARDAMPAGGTLTIATRRRELGAGDIRAGEPLTPGPHVEIAVSDSGRGMSEAELRRACEPFFTTKPRGRGTGLGLATTRASVEQHGGALRIESRLGYGTTAIVLLRCTSSTPPRARLAPPRDDRILTGKCVLLVEDEPALLELFRCALDDVGLRTHVEGSAAAAIARWPSIASEVDLLISDVVLPCVSGPELHARLRERRPDLPVLYVSGYDDASLSARGTLGGSAALLQKPFGIAQFVDAVRSALTPAASEP